MIPKLTNILKTIFVQTPLTLLRGVSFVIRKQKVLLLILIYAIYSFLSALASIPVLKHITSVVLKKPIELCLNLLYKIKIDDSGINSVNLISMGVKNITHKKARSFITIGGMAIGIGSIVFLLSVGYGLQRMVVNKVARLDELKQANITAQPGSRVRINDEQLSRISKFQDVKAILPLISVVGRISYQNSVVDLAVYGVTSRYLAESAEKPVQGVLFKSDALSRVFPDTTAEDVAGASTRRVRGSIGDEIGSINYTIDPEVWIKVRDNPNSDAPVIGFAKRLEGQVVGKLTIGSPYANNKYGEIEIYGQDAENSAKAGQWLKATFPLWEEAECDPVNNNCDQSGDYRRRADIDGSNLASEGYIDLAHVTLIKSPLKESGQVLGLEAKVNQGIDTIDLQDLSASASALVALTEIASESAKLVSAVKNVDISKTATKQAVVNRAMLTVLNIKESEAIGKEFETTFVVTGDLLNESDAKIESNPVNYKIVGVVAQNSTPFFYVPFIDLRSLGVDNFSQAKLISKSDSTLNRIRQQVEGLGFSTTSASDTVAQIDSLFQTVRFMLLALGIVALSVAAMGMFNTLTVSLLERTHEVGLMKTMGMKSNEIENLFLVESVVMGMMGGIAGLIVGFAGGKLAGLVLTLLALRSGIGVVDIAYIPPDLIFYIVLLSLFVGFVTGIYPAQRAKYISALNALHYE